MNYNKVEKIIDFARFEDSIKQIVSDCLRDNNGADLKQAIAEMKRNATDYLYQLMPVSYIGKVEFVKSYYAAKVCKIDNVEDARLVHDILHYQINKLFFDALESFEREQINEK